MLAFTPENSFRLQTESHSTMSSDPRAQLVQIARLMFDRFLTNSAGGNLSCRVDGHIYITPRYAGSQHLWRLTEEMILVFDEDLTCVQGDPARVSRESRMHFACYQRFPELGGFVHGHARYLDVFACAGKPLPPTNQYTDRYGTIRMLPNIKAESAELAAAVAAAVAEQRELLSQSGLGLLLAWHGAVALGRDLHEAYEVLEGMEWAAHTRLLLGALGNAPGT